MRRAAALFALVGAVGCGEVTFVDPDAARKDALQLADAEQLTIEGDPRLYLHVRLATDTSTAGTELVALTAQGSFQLPWSAAEGSACGREVRCLAFTMPPGLPEVERVALIAPALAHRSEAPVSQRRLGGYRVVADSRDLNTRARVDVLDPLRAYYSDPMRAGTGTVTRALPFLRRFDARVVPGPCGGAPAAEAPGWAELSSLPSLVPARFEGTDPPLACVWVRPSRPAGGPAVAAASLEAYAEVTQFRHVYRPPVERAPIVFLPLFDLEIPNPARCEEAEGLVLSAILEAATDIAEATGVEVLPLAPEEIAELDGVACRQSEQRRFDPDVVLARSLAAIEGAFGPDEELRIVWVYAQNLDLPLPTALEQSFARLRGLVQASTRHSDLLFTLAPNRVQDQLQSDRHLAWLATEEPQFRDAIGTVLRELWPFSTVIHDPETRVALVGPELADAFEAYRVCRTSGLVFPEGDRVPFTDSYRPGPDGPAFRVTLPTQRLLPAAGLSAPTVVVDWAGCRAQCTRAAPDGLAPGVPWLERTGC